MITNPKRISSARSSAQAVQVDLQTIAAMQANNIQRIYTFNTLDFKVFPELTVVTP